MNMIKTTIAALALGFTFAASAAEVPNEFASGEAASAAEVNANFAALVDAVTALEARVDELEPTSSVAGRTYRLLVSRVTIEDQTSATEPNDAINLNFGGSSLELAFDEIGGATLTVDSEAEQELGFRTENGLQFLNEASTGEGGEELLTYTQEGNEVSVLGLTFYANPNGTVLVFGRAAASVRDDNGADEFSRQLGVMIEVTP